MNAPISRRSTVRHLLVLELHAMGLSQRKIATLLRISKTAVHNHLRPTEPGPSQQWFTPYRHAGYLLTGAVAAYLGVSDQRVRELAREGRIKHELSPEGARLFHIDDVEVFVLSRGVKS